MEYSLENVIKIFGEVLDYFDGYKQAKEHSLTLEVKNENI